MYIDNKKIKQFIKRNKMLGPQWQGIGLQGRCIEGKKGEFEVKHTKHKWGI